MLLIFAVSSKSARLLANRCFQRRELQGVLIYEVIDFRKLFLHLWEIHPVGNRVFEAGETSRQGGRQGDQVGEVRGGGQLLCCSRRWLSVLRFLRSQLSR